MRILFAVGNYWPSSGGVQMVTQYLAEGLARKGHDVRLVTKCQPMTTDEDVHNCVKIKRFKKKKIFVINYGDKKGYQSFVLEQCNLVDVLIVICSPSFVAQWIYPIFDKINCHKILFQHGMYDGTYHFKQCHSLGRFLKQLLLTPYWEIYHRYYWKQIMKFEGCIHLFKNDSSYNYFVQNGYYKNHVIMNSCEDEFFNEETTTFCSIKEKYGVLRPYFIYVANYCARKNQAEAIKAFAQSGCVNMDIVFVGSKENEYYKKLESIKSKLFSIQENIHLLHGLSREDTVALIKGSYACVITSENEFLPISIIECMASGKPFISTDVGVVSDIPGGHVCKKKSEISYWMSYYESHPEYVEKLGDEARKYARENCYLQDKIDQMERLLMNINETT